MHIDLVLFHRLQYQSRGIAGLDSSAKSQAETCKIIIIVMYLNLYSSRFFHYPQLALCRKNGLIERQ